MVFQTTTISSFIARRAYCVEPFKKSCVCVRPSAVRNIKKRTLLVTRNRFFGMVTLSSVTNFGSERDVFGYLVTKSGCIGF